MLPLGREATFQTDPSDVIEAPVGGTTLAEIVMGIDRIVSGVFAPLTAAPVETKVRVFGPPYGIFRAIDGVIVDPAKVPAGSEWRHVGGGAGAYEPGDVVVKIEREKGCHFLALLPTVVPHILYAGPPPMCRHVYDATWTLRHAIGVCARKGVYVEASPTPTNIAEGCENMAL